MKNLIIFVTSMMGLLLIMSSIPPMAPQLSPSQRMALRWNKDLETIKKIEGFPPESEIYRINYIPSNHLAQTWLLKANPNLNAKGEKKGKYYLEITLMAWAQNDYGLVVQYELFEGKNRKKAWEFARTYRF